ncbi:YrhK family protein [Thiomicrorhabdus arctica]|uniref:YrhK family protein n=1 Tax=Thiomicrorhabdus arctica TaxID=131540 RepID=UPI0003627409|nr:YrhK family protein [Thiomicrorhabdus arctica]
MFFDGSLHGVKANKRKVYAMFEILYTIVDFLAAMAFTIGSIMFLYESYAHAAKWYFIIGSLLFAFKPTIRVVREIRLASTGHEDDLVNDKSSK